MTLATTLPWADEISRESSLVDYASNLADLAEEESLLSGLVTDPSKATRIAGGVAGAFLGAMALPQFVEPDENTPPEGTMMLAGLILGGILGYWQPLIVPVAGGLYLFRYELGARNA